DGSTSTEPFPRHTYAAPGTYFVNLTIDRGNGTPRFASREKAITVFAATLSGTESATLVAHDRAAFDFFGESVAISGNRAVIGVPADNAVQNFFDSVNGFDVGSAYVFERAADGTWMFQTKLRPDFGGSPEDAFGTSVAIHGNFIAVGAPGTDGSAGTNQGSVEVYENQLIGGTPFWSRVSILHAPDAQAEDHFGYSVALAMPYVLVGSPDEDNANGINAGGAHMFKQHEYSPGFFTYPHHRAFVAPDGADLDFFGASVALEGASYGEVAVLIGAPGDDHDVLVDAGSAYQFSALIPQPLECTDICPGGAPNPPSRPWGFDHKFIATDNALGDEFGASVARSLGRVLIGAPYHDALAGENVGHAYFYHSTPDGNEETADGDWQESIFAPSDGAALDNFGFAVALRGDDALVGSWLDDVDADGQTLVDAGTVHHLVRDPTTNSWSFANAFGPTDRRGDEDFGGAIALDTYAIIGAQEFNTAAGHDAGAAFIFTLADYAQNAILTGTDDTAGDLYGWSVALEGNWALSGARGDDDEAMDAGAAYLHRRDPLSGIWFPHQKLVSPDPSS
ncbi:MAG TPA: PKD domain-containing protein, partial [Candidatus Thermoplasmatota archaeon]